MSQSMPIKLSGALVKDARSSAKVFKRSLTGQIEHWATLGRAIESQVSGDALAQLLQQVGGTMKISSVAEAGQRRQVAAILSEFLAQSPGVADTAWLQEMRSRGIPLYGTTAAEPGKIVRLEPTGAPADTALAQAEG
jgi:hypothetical protein